MRNLLRLCAAVVPALALCLALPLTSKFTSSAAAPLAAINVNSTSDAAANDGLCTLREAITAANLNAASGAASGECAAGAGDDTITFSVTGTINLTGALPDIASNVTISGPGSAQLTVRRDTGGNYRIFTVNTGVAAAISGLTATNGRTPDGAAGNFGGDGGNGGGVSNSGTLTLTDVTVTGNATGAGGAGTSSGGKGGSGGGLSNSTSSTLTLTNCTVSNNTAGAGGGGNNGGGDGGSGGGVFNQGALTMTSCVVSGNTTGRGGDCPGFAGRGGDGGGVLSMINTAALTGVAVTNNTAGDSGTGNGGFGGMGGGFMVRGASTMTLTNSTVSGNKSGNSGGPSGTNGFGGGAMVNGALFVSGSTFSGNTTGGPGGGLMNQGVGFLKMVNSTVSGNLAGNGIQDDSSTTLSLTNCTVTNNAPFGVMSASGSGVVRNSILAGNNGGSGPDASGNFASQGHNLVGNANGSTGFNAAGDQKGSTASPLNARLGPLADNGGPTQTHALLAGSPALDAGDNALALDANNNPLTTDQRGAGFPRFADAADADAAQTVDIGAFEAHPSVEDIANKTTGQNVPLSFSFNVGDAALGIGSVTASSDNATLVPNDASHVSVTGTGSSRTLQLTPASGQSGSATITVTVAGTNGRSMSDTFVLTVVPVNQAPTLNSLGDLVINEDAGTQTVNLGGISAGAGETQALTVTASSSDTTLIPNPTVTYSSPAATGSVSFASVANRSGSATITVTVKDNGGTADGGVDTFSRTFNVTVTAVNDAPVNTVPGAQATIQHAPVVFSAANSNAVSVADIDAGTDPVRVTLTATNGTVTLGSTAGLTFSSGDGTDDFAVAFSGTIPAINAALNGLSFMPARNFYGAATLEMLTDDLAHNGSGGVKFDSDNVTINVAFGGAIQYSAGTFEANEDGATAIITVARTGGSAGAASVEYSTGGGTATGGAACGAGVDYVSASGTLSWADGDGASKTFSVTLCDDTAVEGDETVGLSLTNVGGSGNNGSYTLATLTIKDVEPAGGTFEFSQSAYNVAEGLVALTVTVQRSGNTASAADVDYATDDGSTPAVSVPCTSTTGLALDRCDYTKALGTLHFAAGETSKTFQVLVSDDSYTEGSETAQLKLSNPTNGAQLGPRATAVLTITDDSQESAGNPVDDDTKFVTQHYHDFLNREPDAPGLAFWVGEITSCGADAQCREVKRINVSAAFFLSIEFQNTGYLVERVYKTAYGDANSPNVPGTVPVVRFNEFLPDTQRIGKDVVVGATGWEQTLEANKQAYALEFVQRQRFLSVFPASLTAAQFVDKLAQNAGVTLTTVERDALISTLGATPSDASKRAQVLRSLAEHQQLRQAEFNRAFVLMEYFGYLRRDPDAAPDADFRGWKFWLDKLNEFNGDYIRAEMVKAFISSDEYRHRFGQ